MTATATAAVPPSPTAPPATAAETRRRALAAIAVVPILASVYQTLVLTDVTSDVIRKGLEADAYQMIWSNVTWGVAIVVGVFGGLAMMAHYGARSTLTLGLAVFALGNYLCGAATDVETFSGAKLVEGIGKGMVVVLCRSTMYRQFDHMVLVAIGIYGILAYSTRLSTPLFTAYVNDYMSWRWIFWVNVPVALIGMVLVRMLFRPDRPPKPLPLRIDWFAVGILSAWLVSLIFVFGWYRKWGGWSSDEFTIAACAAIVLPIFLLAWVWGGFTLDDHLQRILKVRGYLLAMATRMLLLLNLLAVLSLMASFMLGLRGYPREVTAGILACAAVPMAATTLLTTLFHRRALRPFWLFVGLLGSAACVWWMSTADNFTPKNDLAVMLAIWGACLGLLPPIFLTDEVESLSPRDALYAGGLSFIILALPMILVPTLMQTTIAEWTDRAVESQRQNLREERPAVRDATAALIDDYRQRGSTPQEAQVHASTVLGTYVHVESAARGIRAGLRFMSLVTGVIGLVVALIRLFAPGRALTQVTK